VTGRRKAPATPRKRTASPTRLTGGNPQISKGYGDAPVRAYLAALRGWKKTVGRKLDALISRTVPTVSKAVKYNSPLYGMDGHTWFLSFHCFDAYIKVTFFRGTELEPMPPVESKVLGVRYFHIHETDTFDDPQLATWVKQASQRPGHKL
jgi:hypothetical protein